MKIEDIGIIFLSEGFDSVVSINLLSITEHQY